MSHYQAVTMSPVLKRGSSVAIKSANCVNEDTLDIHLSSGKTTVALIESVNESHLTFIADGQTFECHPWRMGDRSLPTDLGPTSNWLVQ